MTDASLESILYPAIEPYRSGALQVDELHRLYWEECGNPDGVPVLFLHGGPGAGLTTTHRRFFDPTYYRIVLFDQRGAGKSTPLGEYRNNTTPLLIEDIERIRQMLNIDRWMIFGGSWGSTLALAYGQAHPEHCTGFVLRGIFLCTSDEIDWFLNGIKWFFPEVHEEFVKIIPPDERSDLLRAYAKRLFSEDPGVYLPAARAWGRFEGSCLFLQPNNLQMIEHFSSDAVSIGVGRLEAHYFLNHGFFTDDQLVRNVHRIQHLPAVIVQGRYDVVCPPQSAYRLHKAWPQAHFRMIDDAGHAGTELSIARALVAATDQFKIMFDFN
jgi:proline iminopeptidase